MSNQRLSYLLSAGEEPESHERIMVGGGIYMEADSLCIRTCGHLPRSILPAICVHASNGSSMQSKSRIGD